MRPRRRTIEVADLEPTSTDRANAAAAARAARHRPHTSATLGEHLAAKNSAAAPPKPLGEPSPGPLEPPDPPPAPPPLPPPAPQQPLVRWTRHDPAVAAPPPAPLAHRLEAQATVTPQELADATENLRASRSENTQRTYASAWKAWEAWCLERTCPSLPASPGDVALYLSHLGERLRPSSIDVALAAIAKAHVIGGHPSPRHDPVVAAMRSGLRRRLGSAQTEARAVEAPELVRIVASIDGADLADIRDRALILAGWSSALRRSSIVALDVADLAFRPEGVELSIRREKQDQEGKGRVIGLPASADPRRCPAAALRAWLDVSGIVEGAVFRAINKWGKLREHRLLGRDVARILRRRAAALGLELEHLSGHSLRAGFATSAIRAGRPMLEVMGQTGHKSADVFGRYFRRAGLFHRNPADGLLDAAVPAQPSDQAPDTTKRPTPPSPQ